MSKKLILATVSFAFLLSACSSLKDIQPKKEYGNYKKPAPPIPATLPSGGNYANLPAIAQKGFKWQDLIKDKKLIALINIGLENNRDLRASLANIEMAHNQYLSQKSALKPTIVGSGSIANTLNNKNDNSTYSASLGLSSYELDLFGRVKSLTNVQYENYVVSKYDWQSAKIALIAEIATAYVNLAKDIEDYNLAKKSEATYIRSLQLVNAKFKAGLTSRIDVRQAETSLASARSDIVSSKISIEQDKNAIALLIGAPFNNDYMPNSLASININNVPIGLSSEVLLARPDVLAAEHSLASSYANVDVARAALFPKITLTSALGLASTALSSLLNSNAFAFTNSVAISQNIYGGSNKYTLAYSEAERQYYVAKYEKAIQSAFSDVADSLATYSMIDSQLKAQKDMVDSSSQSLKLSSEQYSVGLTSYLTVLDSQRTYYSAQKSQISMMAEKVNNKINLYRMIGSDNFDVPK